MALKLGKCRLCLKLGDFYSIFTVDNAIQLSEMVMECARIKVYEGDGLPDKVCSECIQKLSSAYIFKQQCERADQELRRNYVAPPGFSVSPPPPARESSDSAFSTHTDSSNLKSSARSRAPPPPLAHKRSLSPSPSPPRSPSPSPSRSPSPPSPPPAKRPRVARDGDDSDASESGARLACENCGRGFKLQIMLKRHRETCARAPPPPPPRRELVVALEPVDGARPRRPTCRFCTASFKTAANLDKHLRVVHAAAGRRAPPAPRPGVQCPRCARPFAEYVALAAHLPACGARDPRDPSPFVCSACGKSISRRQNFLSHVRSLHFPPAAPSSTPESAAASSPAPDPSSSPPPSPAPAPEELKCRVCDKEFKYRKSLASHELKHAEDERRVKAEPVEGDAGGGDAEGTGGDSGAPEWDEEEQSEGEAEELTCDICEKMFSYRRLLEQHKRTKHNVSSGTKRAKINLKDCSVRCLLCDLDMKVSDINDHNQKHISRNIKPRNVYTCAECQKKFKSCSNLANHIKLVHRLKRQQEHVPAQYVGTSVADFCEVVVTKAEPVDQVQGYNGLDAAPSVQLGGFTCPLCGKAMPTLLSLKRHVNWHSNVGDHIEKKHECFVCKETFRFQRHYKLHMREHYRDPALDPALLTCDICGRVSKHLRAAQAHMNYHKQTRFQNKDYECSICKRVFQHRRVYLSHMAVHYKRGDSARGAVVGAAPPAAPAPAAAPAAPAHTCELCGKACDSALSLQHHARWHRSKTLLYGARHECGVCGVAFTNKRRLELHTRQHYEDEAGAHRCPVCGKGFTDEAYMRRHHKGHNFDTAAHRARRERLRRAKLPCPACPRLYADAAKLLRHARRAHPGCKLLRAGPDEDAPASAGAPAAHACTLCARRFADEERLRRHELSHARKPTFYACKFCGHKSISAKRHSLHVKAHLTAKYSEPLRCPRCPETFGVGYALHRHLRAAHGVTETWAAERREPPAAGPLAALQCGVCRKVLASRGNYERHLDYHNSLRCNYCSERFTAPRFLSGHLAFACRKRRLVGDTEPHARRVKCPRCYKPFHLQVKLDCHLRTAHGERAAPRGAERARAVVCDFCFRDFPSPAALASHRVYHRSVGYYGCRYCASKFNSVTAYNKHKTRHLSQLNQDEPTRCAHCDRTFVAFREMIAHMREAHGDDSEWIVEPEEAVEETCPLCRKRFFNLRRHLEYHEENKCGACGEYFLARSRLDAHECPAAAAPAPAPPPAPAPAPEEDCAFCFKPVTRKNSRKMHDALHGTSAAISCRFCELKFKTLDAFNVHAFSHRSRKYAARPLRCRTCAEPFERYGPLVRHVRAAHGARPKMHYRAAVRPERCAVCGGAFPNLHNHYRAHLANRCAACLKYFTSARLFRRHRCDRPDADPQRVFLSDADLPALIRAYVPRDIDDDSQKFYRGSPDPAPEPAAAPEPAPAAAPAPAPAPEPADARAQEERELHMMASSPIISDVLSLYRELQGEGEGEAEAEEPPVVLIDSD